MTPLPDTSLILWDIGHSVPSCITKFHILTTIQYRNLLERDAHSVNVLTTDNFLLTLDNNFHHIRITFIEFVLNFKGIGIAVRFSYGTECDRCVCFCRIHFQSRAILRAYEGGRAIHHDYCYMIYSSRKFDPGKCTSTKVIRPLQTHTFSFHNTQWVRRCSCNIWWL